MEKIYSEIKFYYTLTKYINLNIQDLTIKSSNDTLTDTCDITISKLNTYSNYSEINIQNNSFKLGSKVEVILGYGKKGDKNIKTVFVGFLAGFKNTNENITLNFEDEMYIFKTSNRIKKSYPNGKTLKEILELIFTESKISPDKLPDLTKDMKVIDIQAGTITLLNYMLPSEVLSLLKERFGLYSFFRNGVLYFGHKYWAAYEADNGITGEFKSKTFKFKYPNVRSKPYYYLMTNNDLEYTVIDKNQYKVKGSSIYVENGVPTGITYEYPEGIQDPKNIFTIKLPDTDLTSLKKIVKETWDNLDKGGFIGTFTCFGYPLIRHGDVVDISIDMSHIKNSPRVITESYFVDEVETLFGKNVGYKQNIKLGNKLIV